MAFGIKRAELVAWKKKVRSGEIAFLTHYWIDDRFPGAHTVTKVGCADLNKLIEWGKKYDIPAKYIHHQEGYPHFDLLGDRQVDILSKENMLHQLERFHH
ncbi:hypothetical protein [Priestia koreensis]|uniref:YneQ n=1 Tax=Priestia koreensis TaxID=284581 RepID=A0A0M0L6G5_9BACI|nr:hypothetical protein [Priestia koreensis]KOO46666.1 hypothetical protein AMD01_10480 [Priestia koreensis]